MAVRSRQLGSLTSGIVGLSTSVYVVPKDRVAVVRHVVLTNTGTQSMGATLARRRDGVTFPLVAAAAVGVGVTNQHAGLFLVLHPQDELVLTLTSGTAGSGSGQSYSCSVFGALLDGNPPT